MKIAAEGAELHVHVAGPQDGPVLLLLHAFPLHGGMWAAQVEALLGEWRVVVPDFRGFGQSDVGDGQYAIDFYADDLFKLLEAPALALEGPVVACGLSMGGYVLLRAVEREPDRFRALVLADTRSGADDDEGRLKRLAAVRTLRRHGAAAYATSFAESAVGRSTREHRPEVVEAVKAMARANPVAGMVGAQLAMAARTDTTASLARIDVPTLVVVGEEDTLTPPDLSREMAGRIGGARLEVLPGAGHLTSVEAPEAFNRALKGFLGTL